MQSIELCAALERVTDVALEADLWRMIFGTKTKDDTKATVMVSTYRQGQWPYPLLHATSHDSTIGNHMMDYMSLTTSTSIKKKEPRQSYWIQKANFSCEGKTATINKYNNSFIFEGPIKKNEVFNQDPTTKVWQALNLEVSKPMGFLLFDLDTDVTINTINSDFPTTAPFPLTT
jgi:hypothetical protein